jgi:dihydrolipoamide dehydrogenase
MNSYDAIIIGSGPGGYVSAIRYTQLGMKTAIIERYDSLGGTCLNVGCIPSKALLDSSEHFHQAAHQFEEHGIETTGLQVNMEKMIARKNDVVQKTVQGVEFLMKKNKIDVIIGHASFTGPKEITVAKDGGDRIQLTGKYIVIATGSKPSMPAAFHYDKTRVITSTEALNIEKVPGKMVIVGGGVIGLEMGSVFARLGTEIIVVEFLDRILPGMDKDVSREMTKSLKKLGFSFYFNHKVDTVTPESSKVKIAVSSKDGENSFELDADYCLVSIGRRPYTDNLGLEHTSVKKDARGFIMTDEHLQTAQEGVFAIGDVIGGAMLAHKAEDEGVYVAEYCAGQKPHLDYNLIPGVVYTWPEAASVGATEEELKDKGIAYKKGKFSYRALGRARASMDLDGFVKILADKETDEVLGVHMVGARAADMIQEATAIMEFRGAAEDIARMCHPHPTFTEAIKEAALDVDGRSLHM